MSPMSPVPGGLPDPTRPASSTPTTRIRRRRVRGLCASALATTILVPLQGAITPAASARSLNPEEGSHAAASGSGLTAHGPHVSIAIDQKRAKTTQHVAVRLVVRPPSNRTAEVVAAQERRLKSARVEVEAVSANTTRSVRTNVSDRVVNVLLPRLPQGVYRIRATFLGTRELGRAGSRATSLRVVAAKTHFPNAANTGVPAGTRLTQYKGPCVITSPNTVIDSKRVSCDLAIRARHVVIRNSSLRTVQMDQDIMHAQHKSGWSFAIRNSVVHGGHVDGPGVCCGNYRVSHVEMKGGHNGAQCENDAKYCVLKDSWIHAQYEPKGGQRHLGGFLNDGGTPSTLIHNRITCDARAENDEGGCTGDINLIPNFGVMAHVWVEDNYLGANANSAYCTYAGATPGTAAYARRSNHIVYRENVFERADTILHPAPGQPRHTNRCAAYGPVVGFDFTGRGNVWSGNHYSDGTRIRCNKAHRCD